MKENELQKRKYTWAIISTLKQDIVKSLLLDARLRRSVNSKEKSDSLTKISQEFYDTISAIVSQKRNYDIFFYFKIFAHRDVAPFLLRKNTKYSKTQVAAKKYPAKLSSLENSSRKWSEDEKKESMKSPSKYYNTIEIENEDPDLNLQSIRKHTSSGFDPDLNKNYQNSL